MDTDGHHCRTDSKNSFGERTGIAASAKSCAFRVTMQSASKDRAHSYRNVSSISKKHSSARQLRLSYFFIMKSSALAKGFGRSSSFRPEQ